MRRAGAGACVVLALLSAAAAGQSGLSPEGVQRGKQATVLVEVGGGEVSGTAFCIDAGGLFVTNHHVVAPREGVDGKIALVYRPGEADQRVIPATSTKPRFSVSAHSDVNGL